MRKSDSMTAASLTHGDAVSQASRPGGVRQHAQALWRFCSPREGLQFKNQRSSSCGKQTTRCKTRAAPPLTPARLLREVHSILAATKY